MTINVSISQFRQNIADYIAKAKDGYTVILRDEKKDEQIAMLTGKKKFNPGTFEKALMAASGIFSDKNHPEWRTKKDVVKWVEQERKAANRTF
ncbi:hypothetical protein A3J20_03845 [Candidatus Gottesmanbacteria bacterium RIFCSPLOWO2_02_FULL_42_29]|uniref:Antitoxin n=2 Tax=Candidatus Gottesmaniibacteriota TaxID=1752720 RepID=A0A1F6BGW4_9BACT|nr:MAG: hypothetical protein UV09_C0046G0005 [Candidatus Gottesmanbacteria bacterium GW2011_GWA2_42_18]OGG12390.1 MAG: hypothetical protein A2781_03195 [Candidatus Gottesmanbacteria bacterium RIFCSPHIGHO2_01_FULL_42_27]OGG20037.1 MAG: hypothetical protein A3E72_03920 [Candidatus Gottesmanbacteria bacterium RIFCSPHIGHO2_12_FULL_43_26]OGG33750.1 MAG: hypothetical protein A3G68_02745 [Candidatus Gottesmanbacteria bacterium RIFCSPLOWO2_12_FULL_42_10]OGG36164.1 MAG: hypothetical protein A2968_05625 